PPSHLSAHTPHSPTPPHDALPIFASCARARVDAQPATQKRDYRADNAQQVCEARSGRAKATPNRPSPSIGVALARPDRASQTCRSEEHTSELQSRFDIVCRLRPEK